MKMMKKPKLVFIIALVSLIMCSAMVVYAIDHSSHYKKLFGYSGWSHAEASTLKFYYSKSGTYNYIGSITSAATAWRSFSYSPFSIVQTFDLASSKIHVKSKNYGEVEKWCGLSYYYESPKRVLLNEYYLGSGVNCAETVAHEFGHLHGLDHYACINELMVAKGWTGTCKPKEGDIAGIYNIY